MPAAPHAGAASLCSRNCAKPACPVCLASDNTRDPFYAYGDLDGLEVLRESARIGHLDHPAAEAFGWARAVSATPARVANFAQCRDHHAPGALPPTSCCSAPATGPS